MKNGIKCFIIVILAAVLFIAGRGFEFVGLGNRVFVQNLPEYRGKRDVLRISPNGSYDWGILAFDLFEYNGQTIEIGISSQVLLDAGAKVVWQVNDADSSTIAGNWNAPLSAGQWHTVQGVKTVTLPRADNQNKYFYLFLTSNQFNNVSFYITDLTVTVNGQVVSNLVNPVDTGIPALYTKWPFPVGVAIPYDALLTSNPQNGLLSPQNGLLRHFNELAPENLLTPEYIMPKPWTPTGAYRWTMADQFVNYAEANGKTIHGHLLFYHQQTPVEFFRGSGREGRATIDELYARMEHHIKTVFEKYRGRIEWWEVVNEVVDSDGNPRSGVGAGSGFNHVMDASMWKSFYTQIMEDAGKTGMDRYEWVVKAFQWARQYADLNGGQNVKLYLNQYGIENRGTWLTGSLRLLDYLNANNAPVDGVGIQGHITFEDQNIREFGNAIDAIAAKQNRGKNLAVLVTELDISLFRRNETNLSNLSASRTTLSERDYNTRLARQAALYREAFNMFEQKHRQGKLVSVTFWNVADGHSWLNFYPVPDRVDYPLLFDRNYQAKPAYHELIKGR